MTAFTGTIGTTYLGAGGTAIGAVVGDWTRELWWSDSGVVTYDGSWVRQRNPIGEAQTYTSRPTGRDLYFEVASQTVATTVGTVTRGGDAMTEWRALNAMFKPYTGIQYLTIVRDDGAGGSVTSVCMGEVVEMPGYCVGQPGGGLKLNTGNIVYPVKMHCPFPFWWSAAVVTDVTTEIGAAAGTCTVDVATDSVARCGAMLTFDVTGNISKVHVANATTGTEFTVSAPANFADGDWIDFYHVDKMGRADKLAGVVDATALFMENAGGDARGSFWLAPGANAITITRITGAGTALVTITHQPLYASI